MDRKLLNLEELCELPNDGVIALISVYGAELSVVELRIIRWIVTERPGAKEVLEVVDAALKLHGDFSTDQLAIADLAIHLE